jgi:hypothetical protein
VEALVLNPEDNVQVKELLGIYPSIMFPAPNSGNKMKHLWERALSCFINPKPYFDHEVQHFRYLMRHATKSCWKSAVASMSSATGGEGDEGGQATRNVRRRFASSTS